MKHGNLRLLNIYRINIDAFDYLLLILEDIMKTNINRLAKRVNKVVFAISIRFPAKILTKISQSTLDAKNAEITASQKTIATFIIFKYITRKRLQFTFSCC